MGAHFAGTDLRVDRIVSSTAVRAGSTARLFRDAFDRQIPLTSRAELYHAAVRDLLTIALEECNGDNGARIMLVGHNPGMHDLARFLCDEGDPDAVSRLRAKFPTAALAEFDLSIRAGPEIAPDSGRLIRFVRPKDLPVAKKLAL